jgi:hypothetical protein
VNRAVKSSVSIQHSGFSIQDSGENEADEGESFSVIEVLLRKVLTKV